jgi:hypothetical protein
MPPAVQEQNQSTTTKHTPGPWEIYGESIVSELTRLGEGRVAANWIAEVDHLNQDDWDGEYSETADANAYLIAAAPLLLEALESIENDDGRIPASIWALRNEAIRKARGES